MALVPLWGVGKEGFFTDTEIGVYCLVTPLSMVVPLLTSLHLTELRSSLPKYIPDEELCQFRLI